jgi:hypothetical protein
MATSFEPRICECSFAQFRHVVKTKADWARHLAKQRQDIADNIVGDVVCPPAQPQYQYSQKCSAVPVGKTPEYLAEKQRQHMVEKQPQYLKETQLQYLVEKQSQYRAGKQAQPLVERQAQHLVEGQAQHLVEGQAQHPVERQAQHLVEQQSQYPVEKQPQYLVEKQSQCLVEKQSQYLELPTHQVPCKRGNDGKREGRAKRRTVTPSEEPVLLESVKGRKRVSDLCNAIAIIINSRLRTVA